MKMIAVHFLQHLSPEQFEPAGAFIGIQKLCILAIKGKLVFGD